VAAFAVDEELESMDAERIELEQRLPDGYKYPVKDRGQRP